MVIKTTVVLRVFEHTVQVTNGDAQQLQESASLDYKVETDQNPL